MTREDPFDNEEWERYADRAISELVPKIRDSAVGISVIPEGRADVKFAVELGFLLMMDKPLLLIVPPGAKAPAKLVGVADEIVEGLPGDDGFDERLHVALGRVMAKVKR